MKKILISVLGLMFSAAAFSQIITRPNPGTLGVGYARIVPDSALYYPSGCGIPSNTARVGLHTAKGEIVKMGALYRDTCGHQTYSWDPALNSGAGGWDSVGKAGGGTGSVLLDSLRDAVSITVKNGSLNTIFKSADESKAGPIAAIDQAKINKIEPVTTLAALRSLPTNRIGPGILYQSFQNSVQHNFIWNASSTRTDDSAMTIKVPSITTGRFERVYDDVVDARWFEGYGLSDITVLDKARDFVLHVDSARNPILQLAGHDYTITRPWFLGKFYGGAYHAFSIHIRGSSNYINSGYGTRIIATFKDAPAIGYQQGKGCELEKLEIVGQFVPPGDLYSSSFFETFATFNDPTCANRQHAVYAGVALDPVGNNGYYMGAGADSGYYPLKSKYTTNGSGSGSTGFYMHDVSINNFVVGFISSVNGSTQNAEETTLEHIRFSITKICIANGQDQEKSCIARDIHAWDNNFEFFNSGTYGAGSPGNWKLENVDIAGAMNTFIMRPAGSFQAMHIENIYAESLVKFGVFNGGLVGSTAKNVNISFATHDQTGVFPDMCIVSDGVAWDGGHFRFYFGENTPVSIAGSAKFSNIYFDAAPYTPAYVSSSQGFPLFIECKVGPSSLPFNQSTVITTGVETVPTYGDFTVHSQANEIYGMKESWHIKNSRPTFESFSSNGETIVVKPDHTFKFHIAPSEKFKYDSLGMVILNNGTDGNSVAGIITELNVQTDSVKVSYVPTTIANGGYYLGGVHQLNFPGTFIADFTNGDPVLHNVVMDYGQIANLVGQWLRIPGTNTGGTYNTLNDYVKIVSYSGSNITLSTAPGFSETAVSINNGSEKTLDFTGSTNSLSNYPGSAPMLRGTKINFERFGVMEEITKGGFNAASGDSRKFLYRERGGSSGYTYEPNLIATDIQITGGTPGVGKVLTSDGTGVATWQTVTATPDPYVDSLKAGIGIVNSFFQSSGTAPTTLLLDNFNAANSVNIGGRVPTPTPLSGGWVQVFGGAEIGISSNVAYSTVSSGINIYYIAGVSGQHDVSAKLVNPSIGSGAFALQTNYTDQNNNIRVYPNGSVEAVLGGSQVGVFIGSATPVAGDVLHALVIGDTCYSFINSVQVGKLYFDHTLYGTNVGVLYFNNATTTFDDFKLTDGNQLNQNWEISHGATLTGKGTPGDPLEVIGGGVSIPVVTSIVDSLFSTLTDSSLVKSFTSTDATPFNVDTILVSAGHSISVEIDANNIRSDGNSSWFALRRYHVISQASGGLLIFSVLDSHDIYSDDTVFSTATFSLKKLDNTHCIIETIGETSRTINQKYNIHFVSTN